MKNNIPKRFLFLGMLTVLGIALLAVGWRGGISNVKSITALSKTPVNQDQKVKPNENPSQENVTDTAGILKPDSTPQGNAVQVQQESADGAKENVLKDGSGYFVEYRLERERSRGQQIQILREIINNTSSDAETRKKSQEQLYVISNNLKKELEVESLIRAKGYQDAVVFLGEKTVTVVIYSKSLNQEDAIKITDLVSRSTGINQQNIVIIPKY